MEQQNAVEDLITKAEEYAKTSYDLSKLQLMDKSGTVVSSVMAGVVGGAIFMIGLLIISMGLALLVGEALGRLYYGFFVVGGGFILIGVFFYFFLQSKVKTAVSKSG